MRTLPMPSPLPCLLAILLPLRLFAEVSIHTDFEGASAKVVALDAQGAVVRMMPGGKIARGWPCWWCFRAEGLRAGQVLRVEVVASDEAQVQPWAAKDQPLAASWSRPTRPAISADGAAWTHGPEGAVVGEAMVYEIPAVGPTLWVAWGPMFTARTGAALIDEAARQSPAASRFVLATTREGREVPGVRIGAGAGKPVLWFQARQHAWESGGSWVAAGLLRWLLSDEPPARRLRETAEVVIVPVMDVDHVTTGDGGKDALPQDHNRDWKEAPHWPEVAAAQGLLLEYGKQGRLRGFFDLHNPGPGDKKAFFFVTPKDLLLPAGRENQGRFIDLMRQEAKGPIPLEVAARESGASYHPLWKQISKNWVHERCGEDLISVTLETAWNTPGSHVEGYEKMGASLGRAVVRYLGER